MQWQLIPITDFSLHRKAWDFLNQNGSNMPLLDCNRSPPPGSAGVSPAEMAAKMAAFPGKGRGSERLRLIHVSLNDFYSTLEQGMSNWRLLENPNILLPWLLLAK